MGRYEGNRPYRGERERELQGRPEERGSEYEPYRFEGERFGGREREREFGERDRDRDRDPTGWRERDYGRRSEEERGASMGQEGRYGPGEPSFSGRGFYSGRGSYGGSYGYPGYQPDYGQYGSRFGQSYGQSSFPRERGMRGEQGYYGQERGQEEDFGDRVERFGRELIGKTKRLFRGPKGYKRSDERIREDVCDMLGMADDIDASEIEVTVSNGEVTLAGTVPERSMRYRVEQMADDVGGVTEIDNQLKVRREMQPSQPQSTQSTTTQGTPQSAFGTPQRPMPRTPGRS